MRNVAEAPRAASANRSGMPARPLRGDGEADVVAHGVAVVVVARRRRRERRASPEATVAAAADVSDSDPDSDPDSARRALDSVVLNIAEGNGRYGLDRRRFFSIALGSLRELDAAIELAAIGGVFDELPVAAARDRLGGLLYAQVHK